jgi:hypothetical protein
MYVTGLKLVASGSRRRAARHPRSDGVRSVPAESRPASPAAQRLEVLTSAHELAASDTAAAMRPDPPAVIDEESSAACGDLDLPRGRPVLGHAHDEGVVRGEDVADDAAREGGAVDAAEQRVPDDVLRHGVPAASSRTSQASPVIMPR